MTKTNAVRLLDAAQIPYTLQEYQVDENNLDAVHVAEEIGIEPERVFKTLVTNGNKTGINVFCIPAEFELDLKKAATASGNKSIEMIKVKDLFELTGYIRGGCSPIGMKKKYPVYIDETAQLHEAIYVSAGMRGLQLLMAPENILQATEGNFADLIR